MAFVDRWLIEGLLTTDAPLHVGSGDTTTRDDLVRETSAGDKVKIEIAAMATDHAGRAYIPATTLKGDLRARAAACGLLDQSPELREAFGWVDKDGREGRGGRAEFRDARLHAHVEPPHPPPYWDARRVTGVAASVALSRATRSASDAKLFHLEFVPADVSFDLAIAGRMSEAEARALLVLLELGGLVLGASTGNGWGRVNWQLTTLRHLDAAGVCAWLVAPKGVGYDALQPLPKAQMDAWTADANRRAQQITTPGGARVSVGLELEFDGRFLVNDTSQTQKDDGQPRRPDHAPRRDARGRAHLPASSFRGALRSQAERILRTLGAQACSPDKPCDAVETLDAVRKLCQACRVFGASGWRAPVDVGDFEAARSVREIPEIRQDFLAIDRFTGGGADHLKFDALAAERPVLSGRLSVDPQRLADAHAWPWALGLLALVLRDVVDGDVCFGFGAAKGYGACRARLTDLRLPEPRGWRADVLAALALDPRHWPSDVPRTRLAPDSPLARALEDWIQHIPAGA